MDFKTKSYLMLTHRAEGLLGPEMYVLPEGISAYKRVTQEESYHLVFSDRENWQICAQDVSGYIPSGTPIVEYGPGGEETQQKTAKVICALKSKKYTGVDVSQESINLALKAIGSIKTDIETEEILMNFWDKNFPIATTPTLAFYAGSSIGNLDVPVLDVLPKETLTQMLSVLARRAGGGWLLVSMDAFDPVFSVESYLQAYRGVAHSHFNLGVFQRMKKELAIEFDPKAFEYRAEFHKLSSAVLHMAHATRDQIVLFDGEKINIQKGDVFHLQNSFKFTEEFFLNCAEDAGFSSLKIWRHPKTSMQLHLLQSVAFSQKDLPYKGAMA